MSKNNNEKYIGWGISIGLHIILILLFFIIKYSMPSVPQYKEDYLEIALGTDEDGFGDQIPEWMDAPAPMNQTTGQVSAQNENHNIETSDNVPDQVNINSRPDQKRNINPNINTSNQNTPNRQQNTNSTSNHVENAPQTDQSNRGRTYTGNDRGGNLAQNNNGGPGRGNNPNNQQSIGTVGGNPQGTDIIPRSKLDNRFIEKLPPPKAKYNEKGIVKIKIWVDREGHIVRHVITSSPSDKLSNIAEEKLKQTRFNKSKTANNPQVGTIEFNFNIK